MNIVYCTTVLPSSKRTGGEIATQSFIDALRAAGHCVTVLGYRRPGDKSAPGLGEVVVGERPIETHHAGLRAYGWLISALGRGRPYSAEKYVSREYRSRLRATVSGSGAQVVVLDHAQMGFLLGDLPDRCPLVYVAHNVERDIYLAQRATAGRGLKRWLMGREARLIGRMEARLAHCADQTWALTASDREKFVSRVPGCRAFVCAVPATSIAEPLAVGSSMDWECGLLGTWTWDANAEGLRWFQREVVPLLSQKWRVAVAGRGASAIVSSPVEALGFVPDAVDFLQSCKVICIPATSGGGVQIKTLDAIASGRPVVATSMAMRGIDSPPPSVRIADTADAFVAALGHLLSPDRKEMGGAALAWSRVRRDVFFEQIGHCMEEFGRAKCEGGYG